VVNQQSINEQLRELALFAGAGGGIIGGQLLGWHTVCAVEINPYAASVLVSRQNDGFLAPFPIWDDVSTFDGKPWHGLVDVVSGGFPCQDISSAGKGAGITGERSGLWKEFARIIGEVRPRYAFIENSPMLVSRGLDVVLSDLAALGYDAEWGVLSAADVGAKHLRERIWIVARRLELFSHTEHNGNGRRQQQPQSVKKTNDTHTNSNAIQGLEHKPQQGQFRRPSGLHDRAGGLRKKDYWKIEPQLGRVADGVAGRVDRLKAIGNGQVPLCAATAFRLLEDRLKNK